MLLLFQFSSHVTQNYWFNRPITDPKFKLYKSLLLSKEKKKKRQLSSEALTVYVETGKAFRMTHPAKNELLTLSGE